MMEQDLSFPLKITLPTGFDAKLLQGAFLGEYRINVEDLADGTATRLDTLHDDLVRSGRLLLKQGNTLFLASQTQDNLEMLPDSRDSRYAWQLPESALRNQLGDVDELRAFVPRHDCQLHLSRLCLLDDEGKTLARIACFQLSYAGQCIQWIEAQELRGYRKAFQAVVKKLAAIPAAEPASYVRLLESLGVQVSDYQAKPEIALQPEAPARDSVTRMIQAHLQIARANEAGVIADVDTEYLHDYRVNLRKIRSILSLLKGVFSDKQTEKLKARLAGFMQVTNRLRDLDVYLLGKSDYLQKVPGKSRPGLEFMFEDFTRERDAVLKKVRRRFESKQYRNEMQCLQQRFHAQDGIPGGSKAELESRHYASHLIRKRYKKVCRIAVEIHADTPDEDVHALRIQCKKLRYLMEFFSQFYPAAEIRGLIKSLKVLQDNLGRFNDFSVQQKSLEVYLGKVDKQQKAERAAIKKLIETLHGLQREEREKVEENFARFNSEETQGSFQALFAREEK